MKRSDVLKLLEVHLDEECGLDFLAMNPDKIAEELLSIIEKVGMLPPYNPIGSEPLEGHIQYCQWEPEEE